jgi:hypothetical protein
MALFLSPVAWLLYSPGQDHIGAIPLDGDGTWYHNYGIGAQIQDTEVLYHDIGESIANARMADIIFLGWSRLIFGLDWRVFEAFEKAHNIKMFNLAFAGVGSGEFSRLVIEKFGLHTKLWVINSDRDLPLVSTGFFLTTCRTSRISGLAPPREWSVKTGSSHI